jgi:hypothetical protein
MKTWEAPKLIILMRGRPEERILESWKSNEIPDGPIANYSQCEGGQGGCPNCIEYVTT